MKLRIHPFLLLSAAVAAITFAASAHATDYTWGGGTGSWTDASWNPGPVSGPTSNSDTATIGSGTVIVNVNNLGVGSLTMSGGTLQAGVSYDTILGSNIQINGTGNVISAPSLNNFFLNGNLTGSGTVSVAGEWAVRLGGNNSGFTGTWINGSLGSSNLTSFGSANSGSAFAAWVLNGGRMVSVAGSSPTISLGSLSGTGGILSNNTGGTVTYSVGGLNTDATFSGQIVNEWGGGGTTAITKVGSGQWTLSGNLSYSGATVINGGNLVIRTGTSYGSPMGTSNYTLNNNSKLTFYSTNNPILDKAITGTGDLYIDGTGAGNQYENRVNIMSDGLKTFNGSVHVLPNGKLAVWGGDGSGAIPDASVVDVAGMMTLYGRSETIGGLTGNGIVQGHNAVLTVANNADSIFGGTLQNNPNESGTLALTKTGSGTLTLSGNLSYSGSTVVNGGELKIQNNMGAGVQTSGYTLNNNSKLTFYPTGEQTLNKAITGTGDLYIDGSGAGNQYENRVNIMSDGLNTFNGSVHVLANGKLAIWGGNGSGAIPDTSIVDVAGLMSIYEGKSETIGGLTGNGIVEGSGGAGVLTVANNADSIFGGTLRNNPNESGTFALTKTGTGTLTLGGTNTYNGLTTVSAGKLIVNGSISASATTVQSDAILGGGGTIGGTVTVNNLGTLAPGASIAKLTVEGNLNLNTGSTFAYEMNASADPAQAGDLQVIKGNLNLGSVPGDTVYLTLSDLGGVAFAPNTTLSLIQYVGTFSGGFFTYAGDTGPNELAEGETFTAGLNTWTIHYSASEGGLNFETDLPGSHFINLTNLTAIPEPGSLLALACLVGSGAFFRGRRSKTGLTGGTGPISFIQGRPQ